MPEHLENPYYSGEQAAAERRVQIGPDGKPIYPHINGGHLGANMGQPPALVDTVLEELQIKQSRYKQLTAQIDALEKERTPLGKEIRQLSAKAKKEVEETLAMIEAHNPQGWPKER